MAIPAPQFQIQWNDPQAAVALCQTDPAVPPNATKLPDMQLPLYGHAKPRNGYAMLRCTRRPTDLRYFTRVKVVVLHSTTATQPESATSFLLLTVTVPE